MSTLEEIAIKDILPNPFQHKDHQIQEEKIEALLQAYKSTGMWSGSVSGRRKGNKVERASGDHRIEAANRLYGPNHKIEIVIEDISDEDMLKRMADENKDEWKTSFAVTMEIIETTVKEFGKGRIHLPPVTKYVQDSKKVRHAPLFIKGKDDDSKHPLAPRSAYNAQTLAEFLNWKAPNEKDPHWTIPVALQTFEQIEKHSLTLDQIKGLSAEQTKMVVTEISITEKRIQEDQRAREEMIKEAKTEEEKHKIKEKASKVAKLPAQVGKAVSTALKSGIGTRDARKVTNRMTEGKAFKPIPPSEKFIGSLCSNIASILSPLRDRKRLDKIQAVIDAKDVLPKEQVERVANFLVNVAEDCLRWAAKLNPEIENKIKQLGIKALPRK